jgi:TPP-dependent pyruvate/acetoin dehydrogenase alpha subunit
MAPASRLDQIDEDVQAQVRSAVEFALEAPFPAPSEVTEDVYA